MNLLFMILRFIVLALYTILKNKNYFSGCPRLNRAMMIYRSTVMDPKFSRSAHIAFPNYRSLHSMQNTRSNREPGECTVEGNA
jgi:phosphatidylserine synthase